MATARAGGYAGQSRTRSLAQVGAFVAGAVFLLVGILGFIPGITTNYDEMAFAGTDSQAELFGIFQVSVLHNIVHLLFGVVGLWAARTWTTARGVPARGRCRLPRALRVWHGRRPRRRTPTSSR